MNSTCNVLSMCTLCVCPSLDHIGPDFQIVCLSVCLSVFLWTRPDWTNCLSVRLSFPVRLSIIHSRVQFCFCVHVCSVCSSESLSHIWVTLCSSSRGQSAAMAWHTSNWRNSPSGAPSWDAPSGAATWFSCDHAPDFDQPVQSDSDMHELTSGCCVPQPLKPQNVVYYGQGENVYCIPREFKSERDWAKERTVKALCKVPYRLTRGVYNRPL